MSRFRTLEVSDPVFEFENLRMVTVKSDALGGRGDLTLYQPAGAEGLRNLPLLVLMHGVYGSHWAWALKGGAHRTAQRLIDAGAIQPLVIAMPSDGLGGDGTGYFPQANADYERWIMDDVVDCAKEVSPLLGDGSALYLAGLSMGGYGALRLGAKHAARVEGISAHSSATEARQLDRFLASPLPASLSGDETLDPLYWMRRHRDQLPPMRFDCGTEDELITDNRRLHASLTEEGIPHEYEEFSGGHTWGYWQEHLEETLRFVERCRAAGRSVAP